MTALKFLTWNVRGMRDKVKRSAILAFLKKQRADIMVLVETHVEGRLQMALRRPWVGWAFHSTHTPHARGVSILVAKSVHFELCTISTDPQGRYVFLSVKLYGEPFLLLAFYVPPPFAMTVILEGITFMANHPSIQAVWLGDFNTTLNPSLDRLAGTPPHNLGEVTTTKFSKLIASLHLIDSWRFKFPQKRLYSCFSATHSSMSRIDFILVSQVLTSRLSEAKFGPRLLSDHSPYWISLNVPIDKPRRAWRLNPFWLSLLPEDDDLSDEWKSYFETNTGSASAETVWESFKLHARMSLISRINKIKSDSAEVSDKAMLDLSLADRRYATDPTPEAAAALKLQTRVVNQLQFEQARRKLFFAKQKLFEHGEKAGKLLAYMVHSEDRPPVVISLHGPEGQCITDPSAVSSEFKEFFAKLYTSLSPADDGPMQSFFETITLPSLTVEQTTLLEAPLTSKEITEAIASFARSKTPGSDGLPIEFYSQYSQILSPKLLQLYNSMFETHVLPPTMREATIVLIPKPGKDPGYPESYRPISLLQVDIKILAKVLANRLNKVILSLIHTDQAGFMPGRNTSFNLRRLYINLQATHDNVGSRVLVTLDTAKAFDSVEWRYLWRCLETYGFGPKFCKWVSLLYHNPTARVVANGWTSPLFALSRGTRQGCPLSPLLYALAAEPLATSIRTNPEIEGCRMGSLVEKISMYADDTLLYLADSGPSLHAALQTIEQFGIFSGLKINWGKSQILPIDCFPPSESQSSMPLQRVDVIKYLGVHISRRPADYIALNVEPLFELVRSKIRVWAQLPLGVWGRINLIKMVLLPKLLYILWHTPTYLHLKYFKSLEALLKPFIWGSGRHKLAWQAVKNPTDMGGMALPDLNLYYIAAQLSQLYHIDKTDNQRFLTLLCPRVAQLTGDAIYAVSMGSGSIGSGKETASTLGHYRRIWELASAKLGIPEYTDYTPLWQNKVLRELSNDQGAELWAARGIYYLHHLLSEGNLKSYQTLKEEFTLHDNMRFRFFQIRHAIQTQFSRTYPQPTPHPIVAIVKGKDPNKLISAFYAMLSTPVATKIAYAIKPRWEREVGILEDEEWEEALETCKAVSPRLSDRLTQIYITHRTYLTPIRVARYKRTQSTLCAMCAQETGTFFHLIWACPKIQDLWKQIITFLHDTMGTPVTLDPKQCLLGIFPTDTDKFTKIFLHESLFSARKIIARKWMRQTPPTFPEWKAEINMTLPYKKCVYINRACPDKYYKIWDRWLNESATCN